MSTMTLKSCFPCLTVCFFLLGGCSPAKQEDTVKPSKSKEKVMAEQKLAAGKAVYEASCAGCHDAGVGDAPKPGDKAAWQKRMNPGMDVVIKKSIEGFDGSAGTMPPKGGNASLTDEEVSNAVIFMTGTLPK